jgi:hypothetical protein
MSWLNNLVKLASTDSILLESSEAIPSETITNLKWDAEDWAAIDKESNQWLGLGIIMNDKELEEFDIVRYWQVFQLFKNLQGNTQANFLDFRAKSLIFLFFTALFWMSSQLRPLLSSGSRMTDSRLWRWNSKGLGLSLCAVPS